MKQFILFKSIISIIFIFLVIPDIFGQNVSKKIEINQSDKYLNFPVRGWSNEFDRSGKLKTVRIKDGDRVVNEFRISIVKENPDWWAFFDLEGLEIGNISVEIEGGAEDGILDLVHASDQVPDFEDLYKERYRQQVHYSQKRGWNNDPNGLIYYNGEWHMYYQHNPYGWHSGNKHWGHATSKDLVHWNEQREALLNIDQNSAAFSGGAFVDPENKAGFRRDGIDPLMITYTRTRSGEHLAFSYDNGKTFEEYSGNPILKHTGRDPKVFWYEPGNHWVMIVYHTDKNRPLGNDGDNSILHQMAIFTSVDLVNWDYQSGVNDFFECPELFELPVLGSEEDPKWIIYDAYGKYKVGDFDGKKFSEIQDWKRFEYGDAFYASQTFSNVPKEDGRRIQLAWKRADTPYMPFNQSMAFPVELNLFKTNSGYELRPKPIIEIEKLHHDSFLLENLIVKDTVIESPLRGDQLHIIAELDKGSAVQFGLNINGFEVSYDLLKSAVLVAPSHLNIYNNLNLLGPYHTFHPTGDKIKFEVIVDRMGMEIFVDDGALYFVKEFNSVDREKHVKIFSGGRGPTKMLIEKFEVKTLKSIWDE